MKYLPLQILFLTLFSFFNLAAQNVLEYNLNKNIAGATYKFSFVHITDTHIGEGEQDYGTVGFLNDTMPIGDIGNPAKRLRTAVNWINEHQQDKNIKFVVVSGDLTGSAETSEFLKFKEIMSTLNVPYVPVIGNHDIWPYTKYNNEAPSAFGDSIMNDIFADVYNRNQLFFDNWNDGTRLLRTYNPESNHENYLQNFSFEYQNFIFYMLDFNPRYHVNKAEPGIGPEAQLMDFNGGTFQWLKNNLANNTNKKNKNIVFVSHHPATDNLLFILSNFVFDLDEYNQLTRMLLPYKNNLALWLTGHIHLDYDYRLGIDGTDIMGVRGMAANKDFDSAHFEIIHVYEPPTTTALKNNSKDLAYHLFPNPNKGKFAIATELFEPQSTIKIYTIKGNLIYEKPLQDLLIKNEAYEFDFSFLEKGHYVMEISNKFQSNSQHFIIE